MDGMNTAAVTILGVFLANISIVTGLFLWVRTETRADSRHNDTKLESTRALVSAIHEENRSFHAALLDIKRDKNRR